MFKKINKFFASSLIQRMALLAFAAYSGIWGLVEPLSLSWISEHLVFWRWLLVGSSLLVAVAMLIPIAKRYLVKFEAGASLFNIKDTCVSTGRPGLTETADGQMGTVVAVCGDYTMDPMDWQVPVSAQAAGTIEFSFKYNKTPFHFYVRVVVVSSDGSAHSVKWIRFDHDVAIANRYQQQEEMLCPYDSTKEKGYEKVTINIAQAVKATFGQGGWKYQRVMIFRVRGEGFIKKIVLKK